MVANRAGRPRVCWDNKGNTMWALSQLDQVPRAYENIIRVYPEDTVTTAARRMAENKIGCLLVTDEQHKLVGIVSERDIIARVVGAAVDPLQKLVRDIMTTNVATCSLGTPISTVQKTMNDTQTRHLPITDNGVAIGMISTRDLMAYQCDRAYTSRDLTIFAMAKLTESRDPETGSHLERVCNYSRVLAEELGTNEKYTDTIDETFVRLIYATSPLHDIGKISIPDYVLLKPGHLDNDEFDIMKTHTTLGAETLDLALKRFPEAEFLRMARDIAASHHERIDGLEGLAGDEIPLSARIFAPADVYDALVSKRVYKTAFTHDIAKNIIVEGKGTQFDSDVVEAFLRREQEFLEIKDRYNDAKVAA